MIDHLERLSLVMFNNKAGVERLQDAIKFANQLYMVNTDGVEPLDNVLEDRYMDFDFFFWVWFAFCFTALQHILGHFGRGQLT